MQLVALYYLNIRTAQSAYRIGKVIAGISAVNKKLFYGRQVIQVKRYHLGSALPVRDVRRRYYDGMRQPLHIDDDMAKAFGNCSALAQNAQIQTAFAICRLIPDTFLPASYPFSPAVSAFWTLCASMIPNVVLSLRKSSLRVIVTNFFGDSRKQY
jgi:hypothetical protein